MFSHNHFDVSGHYVIVAGGSKGLGRELALQLVARGANVIVLARSKTALDETLGEMVLQRIRKDQVLQAESLNLCNPSAVSQFISRLTVVPTALICVAGGTAEEVGFFADIPADAIKTCVEKNYLTSAYIAQALLRRWISPTEEHAGQPDQQRHLVFTASTAALVTVPGYSAYSPTKAALRSLADTLRQEVLMYHASAEIKVHCSFPGTIYTDSFYKEQERKPSLCKQIEGTSDNQGGLTAEEIACRVLRGLEQGELYITSDFQTRLLLNNMRGPSPADSPLVDWFLGFVTSLVWPWIRLSFDRAVRRHGVTDGSK